MNMYRTILAACISALSVSGAEIVLPSLALERDRPVTVVYRTTPLATGKGQLAVRWTDILGRVVEERTIPVELSDEMEIRFPLDLRRAVAMVNDLRVHLTTDGVNKKGQPDRRDEEASVRFVAKPRDRPWSDYAIVMWQPHSSESVAALKTLGINAGQYNGRQMSLPDFLLKNDLRWYAENLATDFYSEYHRYRPDRPEQWSFLEAKNLYNRDPTSKEAFKRHPSFSDPAWRQRIYERLQDATHRLSPYRPLFYDLGDESGIADLAAFWDFDFSDQSLAEMRVWLKERYGTLAALNQQWDTRFTTWDAVTPDTTNEAMKRPGDNFSAWADHKEWMDVSYAQAIQMGVEAVRSVDPDAYVAIAGAQMPGWGGYDYYRLSRVLTAVEPYDIGNNIEILRSINPGIPVVTTAFARGPWEKHRVWYELLHGARGHLIWDEQDDLAARDGSIGARGREVAPYYNEIRNGIGALLIQSRREADPVAIHYSQASMRTEWMLAQRPASGAWVDRTSATERLDGEFLRLRESWCRLTEDVGLQYNFVAYGQVEDGELLRRGYRVLILPRSTALSEAEAGQIRAFVKQGGVLIADGEPGLFDEHSRRLPRPALADLFGGATGRGRVIRMNALAYHQQRLRYKEGELHQSMTRLTRETGVKPEFAVVDGSNRPVVGVETHRFVNGGVTIIGLLTNPQLRVDELGPPEFKSNERFEKPAAVRLALPGELYVYDVRRSKALGRMRELAVTLDPYEPAVFAFSPTPFPALRISAPDRVLHGGTAQVGLAVEGASSASTHVFHVDVLDPAGKTVPHYVTNVIAPAGAATHDLPFAVNDTRGKWTVRVKDLLSGQAQETTIEVF